MFFWWFILSGFALCNGVKFEFLKWKTIEYVLPKGQTPSSTEYIPLNNIPMGVTHHGNSLFITLPRRKPGVLSTLNVIDVKNMPPNSSPKLKPFPSYEENQLNSNLPVGKPRIVSVYRTRTDSCNRLWFIDTGVLQYPGNITRIQAPSIWVINLKNNNIIKRFEIPESSISDGRGLASLAVDVNSESCDKAFAYIPDLFAFKIHVYSLEENHLWSFTHSYFYPDPLRADFNVAGQKFQFRDGIFSITLGNKTTDGFRSAYFHSLASNSEFVVSTKVLRNETNSLRIYHGSDFKWLGDRGQFAQSSSHVYHQTTGNIFFAEISQYAISCWNTKRKLSRQNMAIVLQHKTKMIYPSDITIDSNHTLWTISNRMPIASFSTLDPNDYNFRVFKIPAFSVVRPTVCH